MISTRFVRICAYLLVFVLVLSSVFVLSACSEKEKKSDKDNDDKELSDLVIPKELYEGTWYYKTSDGMKIYYTIEHRKGECYFEASYGSSCYPGEFIADENDDDKKTLEFSLAYNSYATEQYDGSLLFPECLDGVYTYTFEGTKKSDDFTMTLNKESEDSIVLKYVEKPEFADYVEPFDDFEVNKDLLGSWELDNSMYEMAPTIVTFNDDGTMSIENSGLYTVQYMYSPVDNVIKMIGFADQKVENEVEFELKNGNLIFDGVLLTRPGKSTDDQVE